MAVSPILYITEVVIHTAAVTHMGVDTPMSAVPLVVIMEADISPGVDIPIMADPTRVLEL